MHRLVAGVMSTVLLGGCSLSLPDAKRVRREPTLACKTSSARPGADTVLAVMGAVLIVGGFLVETNTSDFDDAGVLMALPGGIMVASGVLGTIYGERSLTACQEREGALASRGGA